MRAPKNWASSHDSTTSEIRDEFRMTRKQTQAKTHIQMFHHHFRLSLVHRDAVAVDGADADTAFIGEAHPLCHQSAQEWCAWRLAALSCLKTCKIMAADLYNTDPYRQTQICTHTHAHAHTHTHRHTRTHADTHTHTHTHTRTRSPSLSDVLCTAFCTAPCEPMYETLCMEYIENAASSCVKPKRPEYL